MGSLQLARAMENDIRKFADTHPEVESEWRLFMASLNIMASCSDQELADVPSIISKASPPWWALSEVPKPKGKRRKFSPVQEYVRKFASSPKAVPFLLLVICFMIFPSLLAIPQKLGSFLHQL